jgi:hypothetical protein
MYLCYLKEFCENEVFKDFFCKKEKQGTVSVSVMEQTEKK